MQITGVLIQTTGVEQISDTFKKTNVIIQTEHDTQYPQEVVVECHNDNIEKLKTAGVKAGDVVNLDVNLRGKKYEKEGQAPRWFNTLVMWKISKVSEGTATAQSTPAYTPPPVPATTEDDDLPF